MFTNHKHQLAHEALKKGALDKSIQLYTEALKEAPDDCNILSDRAVAFLHKNDQLRSMGDFNRAVELDPNYAYRYASRAYARKHFGDLDGAVLDYEKAISLVPDDAVAQNNFGMLLEEQGYQKEAQERFERADKLSKMEDNLYQMMDDLEGERSSSDVEINKTEEKNAEVAIAEEDGKPTQSDEIKKLFTSRKQFREFIQFIRNGFKIK